MKMKMSAWMEKHRTTIEHVANAISAIIWLASLIIIRVLGGAGVILLYLVFTATPESTVYQLSQVTHTEVFWQGAIVLAVVYSAVLLLLQGSIVGGRGRVLAKRDYAVAAPAKTSSYLHSTICVMRGYGFRIVREGRPGDDLQQDSLNAACLLLGVAITDENKRSTHVSELARTLRENT